MEQMRVLLINDTDGRENVGCRLTSRLLKQNIANAFAKLNQTTRIIPAPWRFGRSVGPKLSIRLLAGDMRKPTVSGLRALAQREYGKHIVANLNSFDLIIFQPEGTINQWDDELRLLRFLSLPLLCGQTLSAPLVTINGTFPLFKDQKAKLINQLIKSSAHFSARDKLSAEHFGVDFIPDAACSWSRPEIQPLSSRNDLLITTSAGFTKEKNIEAAQGAIAYCEHSGLRPLILSKQWEDLLPLRDKVLQLGGDFRYFEELEDASKAVSRCKLHIGGRYHMAILCACMDIPSFLVEANTHKNEWLTRDSTGIFPIDTAHDQSCGIDKELQKIRPGTISKAMRMLGELHTSQLEAIANQVAKGQLNTETTIADRTDALPELSFAWPGGIRRLLQNTLRVAR